MATTEDKVLDKTVVNRPKYEQMPQGFVLWVASIADDIVPWGGGGVTFKIRDAQLRSFYKQEVSLASAIYTIIVRNSAYSWTLKGDMPRTIQKLQNMIHNADLGAGWIDFIFKWLTDWLTQDNGAFVELIRERDSENSPVNGINHLDSGRCRRTGVDDWPVIYSDRLGIEHKLKYYQVVATSDWPSSEETANGMGFCAVSRVLRYAQLQRDLSIRDRERASGMDPKTLHIVSGLSEKVIESALSSHKEFQQSQGLIRYSKPAFVSTIDPEKPVSTASIDLAPAPTDWNYDVQMKWYISLLAMALSTDYQDLAPLPAGGIGGSQQSNILNQKSKGKGPELFMKTIEQIMNFRGILPDGVTFEYDVKDDIDDKMKAELLNTYSVALNNLAMSQTLSPQAGRNILLDAGVISQEIFDQESAGKTDATEEVTADSDTAIDITEDKPVAVPPAYPVSAEPAVKMTATERIKQELFVKWQRQMASSVETALSDLYNEIQSKLLPQKSFTGRKVQPDEMLNSDKFWTDFRQKLRQAMQPNAQNVFTGAAKYNEEIGLLFPMDKVNTAALEFTRNYTTEWLDELESNSRESLRQALINWQETGLGKQGLPDLIKSIEPVFGKDRASRIAATEVSRVFDLGNLEAHKAAGIEYEQWQTVNDDRVRPEHQMFNEKVYPIDSGPRPSDYYNCRCERVPITTDEALKIGVTGA